MNCSIPPMDISKIFNTTGRKDIIVFCRKVQVVASIALIATAALAVLGVSLATSGSLIIGLIVLLPILPLTYLTYNPLRISANSASICQEGTNNVVKSVSKGTFFAEWYTIPLAQKLYEMLG